MDPILPTFWSPTTIALIATIQKKPEFSCETIHKDWLIEIKPGGMGEEESKESSVLTPKVHDKEDEENQNFWDIYPLIFFTAKWHIIMDRAWETSYEAVISHNGL